MKQLKFMLAAATAIGLATAAQADTTTNELVKVIFEDYDPVSIPNSSVAGFSYEAEDQDNESRIDCKVAGDVSDMALFVNTGTNPVLRTVQNSGAAYGFDSGPESSSSLYIDTMVQFTVTPADDDVKAGPEDKLMIFLKEVPAVKNGEELITPASTKLMIKSKKYTPALGRDNAKLVYVEGEDVELKGITVVPGDWYRLVVEASVNDGGFVQFRIKMAEQDDDELTTLTNDAGLISEDNTLFPSCQGIYHEQDCPKAKSVQYIGFAGEGMVDDIVTAEVYAAPSIVNFTFAIDIDEGVSSVVYTIGEGESAVNATITADEAAITVASGTKVTLKEINLNALYVLDSDSAKEEDSKTITANGEKFVVKTTALTGEGEFAVPPGTTATQIGITADAFANDTGAALDAVVKWATTPDKGSLTYVNEIKFDTDGNPAVDANGVTNLPAQAYLLNCAVDATAIDNAKKEFTFPSINASSASDLGTWVSEIAEAIKTAKGYNGTVKVYGAAELKDLKDSEAPANATTHKFFRAVLTK